MYRLMLIVIYRSEGTRRLLEPLDDNSKSCLQYFKAVLFITEYLVITAWPVLGLCGDVESSGRQKVVW